MNYEWQYVYGYWVKLIMRKDYDTKKAKRYVFKHSNQNMWIPNGCLLSDGTIIKEKVKWLFQKNKNQLKIAMENYQRQEEIEKTWNKRQ